MISTQDFVRRAKASGRRLTINDHLTLQGITELQARRSKRTTMHRLLQPGEEYEDLLGAVFVPSKSPRGRQPIIADHCEAEDDTMEFTPTMSRHLMMITPTANSLTPANADRVAAAQEVMMRLPLSKQADIADGFLAQQHEIELRQVRAEAAEREAKSHQAAATKMEEMVNVLQTVMNRLAAPTPDNDGSSTALRRRG